MTTRACSVGRFFVQTVDELVQVLASRLHNAINDEIENLPPEARPTETETARLARDAAHWVICKCIQDLREDLFSEIAKQAKSIDARPLPDVMVFPQGIALESSTKNIYGVLPPHRQMASGYLLKCW